MGDEKVSDALAVHVPPLGQDGSRRRAEHLERKIGHDPSLKLIGECGHEDQVARRSHARIGGRRRDHRDAVALRDGPYHDCVRRAVGSNEGDHFVAEDHRFRRIHRFRRFRQAHPADQFDGTAQQPAAPVDLVHRDHCTVREGADARDQKADLHRGLLVKGDRGGSVVTRGQDGGRDQGGL